MKKVMSSIVMAGILAATASAQEGVFVGLHYGSTSADLTATGSASEATVESTGNIGLKAGYATTLEGIGGVRGYYTNDVIAWSNATATTSMISADYLYKMPNNNIELFGGLSVGSADFEVDFYDAGSGSATGFQLGALFKRGGSSDYEVGYRVINTTAEATASTTLFSTTYEYGYELSSISQLYVGANWYF